MTDHAKFIEKSVTQTLSILRI